MNNVAKVDFVIWLLAITAVLVLYVLHFSLLSITAPIGVLSWFGGYAFRSVEARLLPATP
jgi:hypothetical protein